MQYIQPALFPVADLQTDGYARPEPRDETVTIADDEMPEAA
ncbi:hypothetical protein [Streptomyces sp. B6(2022)]